MAENKQADSITILITPRKLGMTLGGITLVIVAAHILLQVLFVLHHRDSRLTWLVNLFNVDKEKSIPTLYSFLLLFTAAYYLGMIGLIKRKLADSSFKDWYLLSGVFLFLSLDETLTLHEKLITPQMSWVTPYMLVCLLFLYRFFNFLKALPTTFRRLFITSGLIYVGEAAGLEIPGGQYLDHFGYDAVYLCLVTLEESFEMLGIVFFIYSLLEYLTCELPPVNFLAIEDEAVMLSNQEKTSLSPAFNNITLDKKSRLL